MDLKNQKKNIDNQAVQDVNFVENGRLQKHENRGRSSMAPNSMRVIQTYDIDSVIDDHNNNTSIKKAFQQRESELTFPSIISVDTSEIHQLSKTSSAIELANQLPTQLEGK